MKKFGICVLAIAVLGLSGCGGVDKEKLVGVWVVEDGPDKLPKGTTMEFTADNKVKMGIGPISLEIGTYELSGNIITLKPKDGKEGKARITKLEGDELVMKDDAETKELKLKRQTKSGDAAPKGKQ